MRNTFFTLTLLILASILLYACGNETDNPVLTDGFDTDNLVFASPGFQGDAEGHHGWRHQLGENDAGHFDDEDAHHFGPFMNGERVDVSIEKVEIEGEVVEVFPSGNFTLQTEAEEVFVMLRHHRGNRRPVSRHHGMGRWQNVRNRRDIGTIEGIEVSAQITAAGYLMTHTIQDDEAQVVNRLLAIEITKGGEIIYTAEEDDFWHGMGDGDDMPMNVSVEKTEVSGEITEVLPNGNFTLQTEIEEIFVTLHHHRGNRQPVLRRHGMRRWRRPQNRLNAEEIEGIEVGAKVTVTGYLMTHNLQDDEGQVVNNRLLATQITKDGEIIYTADDDDFWHCLLEQSDDVE